MEYDLVFEGGGAKGIIFVGALQAFEARGHRYDRLLGTSAGAITAALLAASYSVAELLDVLSEEENGQHVFAGFLGTPTRFDEKVIENSVTYNFLQEIDVPLVPDFAETAVDNWLIDALMKQAQYRNLFSFVEEGGWFSADKFVAWLQKKLDSGRFKGQPRNFSQMNLAQFFEATGHELSVVATDTSGGRMLVLNHTTAPDCPLVWAVRMSMSIPLLWPEVEWQTEWGKYRGRQLAGHLIVDGGLLSNFPLELFVSNQPQVTAVMGPKKSQNILGLLIDESRPVEVTATGSVESTRIDFNKLRTVRRIQRLINTAIQAHDKMVIEAFEKYVVRLPAHGYGTTEFDMSAERRNTLLEAGRQTMEQYFDAQPLTAQGVSETPALPDDAKSHADRIAASMLAE